MPSKSAWQQQGDTLIFTGEWNHHAVSQHWHVLQTRACSQVDVAAVSVLDSSFLTLLLTLPAQAQPVFIQGASRAMLSLIELYNLGAFFQIDPNTKAVS